MQNRLKKERRSAEAELILILITMRGGEANGQDLEYDLAFKIKKHKGELSLGKCGPKE